MENFNCVYCNEQMQFLAREEIQLGKTGFLMGSIPNALAGTLEVDIYMCPYCRKLEFYAVEDGDDECECEGECCCECEE